MLDFFTKLDFKSHEMLELGSFADYEFPNGISIRVNKGRGKTFGYTKTNTSQAFEAYVKVPEKDIEPYPYLKEKEVNELMNFLCVRIV
jgi:hypothetical protein